MGLKPRRLRCQRDDSSCTNPLPFYLEVGGDVPITQWFQKFFLAGFFIFNMERRYE